MDYSKLSINQLEAVVDKLYQEETHAHDERSKATAILRLKKKRRDAMLEAEGIKATIETVEEELSLSWFDRLRERVGL